jgi:hypothetical protein
MVLLIAPQRDKPVNAKLQGVIQPHSYVFPDVMRRGSPIFYFL